MHDPDAEIDPLEKANDAGIPVQRPRSVRGYVDVVNAAKEFGLNATLSALDNRDLAAFHLTIRLHERNMREHCEKKPWFAKVETLFTEDGGENIHHELIPTINRIVSKRLTKKEGMTSS